MNEIVKKELRPELLPYAGFYEKIMGSAPNEGSMRKMDAAFKKLLLNRWLSHHSEAHEIWIKRPDGSRLRLLVVIHKNHHHGIDQKDTGVLWIHGGGYMIGIPEMDFVMADMMCENDDAVVILPDYRKAVEAPYPAALDDCSLALDWMKQHAEVLGINKDQLFVGGESAGGGLACALSLKVRDEGKTNIAFLMPLYPMISDRDTPSSANNHLPVWNTAYNHLGWQMYRGSLNEPSAYFSPARETEFSFLPPAFTFVSDIEPFYDETRTYFENLYKAGSETMIKIYHGCFHAFDMTAPGTSISKKAKQLERNVFHYAQHHFFAKQPVSGTEQMISTIHEAIDAGRKVLKTEDKEDVFENLQKIIADDTEDTLRSIEKMVDQLH